MIPYILLTIEFVISLLPTEVCWAFYAQLFSFCSVYQQQKVAKYRFDTSNTLMIQCASTYNLTSFVRMRCILPCYHSSIFFNINSLTSLTSTLFGFVDTKKIHKAFENFLSFLWITNQSITLLHSCRVLKFHQLQRKTKPKSLPALITVQQVQVILRER